MRPVDPAAPLPESASEAKLNALIAADSKWRGIPSIEVSLTVRAIRSGAVRFDRGALTTKVQDLDGKPVPSTCVPHRDVGGDDIEINKGDLIKGPHYVRPGAGQSFTVRVRVTGYCRAVVSGHRYAIVGVFDPGMDHVGSWPQDGATLVTRRVESKRIVIRWPSGSPR